MSRELTHEQFADGSVIDPRRLDKAVKDLTEAVNTLDRGYLAQKWMESRIVRSWRPWYTGDLQHFWPFLRDYNDTNDVVTGGGDADDISNPHREKGYAVPGIPSTPSDDPTSEPRHYIWTEKLYFNQPAILSDWMLLFQTDGAGAERPGTYDNDGEWGADDDKPEGVDTGDARRDLTLNITVSNPLDLEDRSLTALVAHQSEFSLREAKVCQFGWPSSGWSDGYPSGHPDGALAGIYKREALYIPIPAGSRVLVSCILPYYNQSVGVDNRGWGSGFSFVRSQVFHQALTFLELIENAED